MLLSLVSCNRWIAVDGSKSGNLDRLHFASPRQTTKAKGGSSEALTRFWMNHACCRGASHSQHTLKTAQNEDSRHSVLHMGIGKIQNQFCGEQLNDIYTKRSPTPTNLQPRNLEITLTFRVTGAASVARLEPLLLDRDCVQRLGIVWFRADDEGSGGEGHDDAGASIDFVWETIATKHQRAQHRKAAVLNRLSGAQVLEDKANLALLQRLMTAPTLESYVVEGRGAVVRWANARFGLYSDEDAGATPLSNSVESGQHVTVRNATEGASERRDFGENWWCVKAAGGNGGMDVWVLHARNWRSVAEKLQEGEDYVIQRYVAKPMLWRGRKFHFRCYAALSADMSAWLYRTAYILCASRPYSLAVATGMASGTGREGLVDELVHVSNLAVNKHTDGHPGQVPCDLPLEYPDLWPRMLELLRSLVDAATPYMQHQAQAGHFEFLGLDVIADDAGGVWLMEANRLPGLQSSKQNFDEENKVYDRMMLDLIRLLVLPPLIGCPPEQGLFEAAAAPASDARVPSTETWRNVLRFAAFKRACKIESTCL